MEKPIQQTSGRPAKLRAGLKALIIDDDPLQAEHLADTLRDIGVSQITLAGDGDAALRALSQSKAGSAFDVAFCDLHMPGMDGFQFMNACAQKGFRGAFIIVSGQNNTVRNSASLVAQLQRLNLLGSLPKPVEKSALEALISRLST